MNRRDAIRVAGTAAGLALAAPFVNIGRYRLTASPDRAAVGPGRVGGGDRPVHSRSSSQEYTRRCIDLVTGSLVIDMLGLTTLNSETRARWGPDFAGMTEADVAEFRDSEIDVFHIARGVGVGETSCLESRGVDGRLASRPWHYSVALAFGFKMLKPRSASICGGPWWGRASRTD